jgi:hypothetical protein
VARASAERAHGALSLLWLVADHVDHAVERPCLGHLLLERGIVCAVARDDLCALRDGRLRPAAVIERHIVAALAEIAGDGRTDQTGAADDKDLHVLLLCMMVVDKTA